MTFLIFFLGLLLGAAVVFVVFRRQVEEARRAESHAEGLLEAERKHAQEMLAANAEALRKEFKAMANDLVQDESARLRQTHLDQLVGLLNPLEKDMNTFRTQMTASDAALRQQMKDLFDHTSELGRRADNLAKALTTDSKKQGNWGEAVLRNILEASGLTEGRDFEVQVQTTDAEGRKLIPDVVVHLPDSRDVIIDSKVSLTAFSRYVAATDKAEQELHLKDHLRSVRQHITELSRKDYTDVVENSIGYVLLFIPNEPAYLAAVDADANLTADAYRQQVILINPSNLFMALQLAYNLWQTELREAGVKEIYQSAEKLYAKFVTFSRNFVKVGETIDRAAKTYEDARKQLCEGRGNIVHQLEAWKKRGLNPKEQLPADLQDTEEAEDE